MLISRHSTVLSTKRRTYSIQRLTNPYRAVVSDSSGYAATFTNGSRTVLVRGPQRTFSQVDLPITDQFNRTRNGSGWAAANFGGSWSHTGGSDPADYSVNGTEGTMLLGSTSVSRRSTTGASAISTPDVTFCVKSDKLAEGDAQLVSAYLGYQDIDNNYQAKMEFLPGIITDDFSRTTSSTWSSTSVGYSWASSGGSATDFSTTGTVARHAINSLNVGRRSVIGKTADSDITYRVRTSATATGSSITSGAILRYVDSSNYYLARVRFSTTQTVLVVLQKNVAGTFTDLTTETTVAGLTHAANTWINVRTQITGTSLKMKVWADATVEPATWNATVTDTTFSGAYPSGLRSIAQTGNTNTLPLNVEYDDWRLQGDSTNDSVKLTLQKEVAGVTTSISSGYLYPATVVSHAPGAAIKLRAQLLADGTLRARAWPAANTEPTTWEVSVVDTTYTSGKVGMRSMLLSSTTNAPVKFAFDDFLANGAIVNPPTVTHAKWIRILPTSFTGTVDEQWLTARLSDTSADILSIAMEYLPNKPPVYDAQSAQIAGDTSYGPLLADGKREEGSDFNDYLGISWQYGTYTDTPEPAQRYCLDCSGYVRMVYGYRGGFAMTSSVTNGVAIPRVSSVIINSGPGILVVPPNGTQVTDLSLLQPGDILGWDADTSNPDEVEGQIDHVGIYLGLDTAGKHRFLSSRKSNDGPSMSDAGGSSILEGTGLYARSFRSVRRF